MTKIVSILIIFAGQIESLRFKFTILAALRQELPEKTACIPANNSSNNY